MYCIKHLIHISTSSQKVYEALTSIDGLKGWWTVQTEGNTELNGYIDFRFTESYFIQMKTIELQENKLVKWECLDAEADWIGTELTFKLKPENNKTILRFTHDKWPTHDDFFAHCNLSWAKYLLSLRSFLETGLGQPFNP